LQNFIILASLP